MADQNPIVIIGAGQAGVQVADSLRSEGYRGQVVLLNDEKTLPYQRPQLSKDFLTSPQGSAVLPLRGADFYAEQQIELRQGTCARVIDPQSRSIILDDGEELGYSHLVIATGTRARELQVAGSSLSGIHRVRTMDDAHTLREKLTRGQRLVVIGAGFIGLEVAAAAVKLGVEVTVLTGDQAPMARSVSPQMSAWFHNHHLSAGVYLADGESAQSFEGATGQVSSVIGTSGRHYPADLVVVGIGALPNVELLENSGIDVDNGVLVNEYLSASAPGVWALGDCAAFPAPGSSGHHRIESVQNATDQARLLARNIIAAQEYHPLEPYSALPWFWSHQGNAKLQIAGLRSPGCTETVVLGDPARNKFSVLSFNHFDELIAVESLNSPADHMAARKILSQRHHPLMRQLAESEDFSLKVHSRALPAMA